MKDNSKIRRALTWECWKSFYDLNPPKQLGRSKAESLDKAGCGKLQPDGSAVTSGLTDNARLLAYDIITYLDSQFSERQQRLNLSARQIENAKRELISKGLIKEVWLGKSLMLAPAAKLYVIMELESPYKRNVSDIHSFLVLLAAKLIKPNPLVKYVKREAPLGDSNSTLDLLVCMKNSQRWAYEITVSQNNVTSNIAKLKGKGFSQIVIVCCDHTIRGSVWATIRNAGFDLDFFSTIRCTIFSALIRQRKQLMLKEMR